MTIAIASLEDVRIFVRAYCHGKHENHLPRYHDIICNPDDLARQCESWEYKHSGPHCLVSYTKQKHVIPRNYDDSRFEKMGRGPWFLETGEFKENNNYQLAFNASAALTFTSLASLASDAALLAGASSAVVDNGASATLLDSSITAVMKTGTSPTLSTSIILNLWTKTDDSTYPDAITGSDATISITSTNVGNSFLVLAKSITVDATTGRVYPVQSISLANLLGWVRYWGVWAVQNTGAALASSGSSVTAKQSYVAG